MSTKTTRFLIASSLVGFGLVVTALAQGPLPPPPLTILGQSSQPLDVGRAIKREIRGGEGHLYEVSMIPGQYAEVRLDIKGPVDLAVGMLGPTGQQMPRVFTTRRTYGPTMGFFIAETPGAYRILVTPLRPPVDVDTYQIKLEEVRPATDKDRALVAAIEEWSAMTAEWTQAIARQDAKAIVDAHKKMLAQTEKLDKRDATYGLMYLLSNTIAGRLVEFKQPALAEGVLKDTLAFFDRVLGPDDFSAGEMLGILSDFYATQNRQDEGKPYKQRLSQFVRQDLSEHNPLRSAIMYMRVGEFLFSERRFAESIDSYARALEFVSKSEGFPNLATTQMRVLLDYGSALSIAGRPPEAITTLNQAHEVLKKNPDLPGPDNYRMRIDYLIGTAHMRMGDTKTAKPMIEAAVADFSARTLTSGVLRDRLTALARLRIYEKGEPLALSRTLAAPEILQETLPELKRIAEATNADYKPFLKQLVAEAPDSENGKELSKLLSR